MSGTFDSASGLRPMSAFVVITAVLATVAVWVPWLAQRRGARQPERVVREAGAPPDFRILDREGRVLAQSVPRFDLEMSPRSMWQAHTPDAMARAIAAVVGEPADELLARMLPGALDGWIEAALELDEPAARRVQEWIARPAPEQAALPGLRVEPAPGGYRLLWRPAELLAGALREARGASSAAAWSRRLADGLAGALRPLAPGATRAAEEASAARDEVWAALFPRNHVRVLTGVRRSAALALRDLLRREGVASWQMSLAYGSERVHPCGEHELVGGWGFPDQVATAPVPRSGLELAAARLLGTHEDALDARPDVYLWSRDRNVRGARASGFLAFEPGAPAPDVRATLAMPLQHMVGRTLAAVLDEHRPALAMAIVVDVASGDVLAVDSAESYAVAPFAPVYHAFTPGSTFKVVTMAIALEQGTVEPGTLFDVGPRDHCDLAIEEPYKNGRGSRVVHRTIREAEGALEGVRTATECLAWSINAGLAQIGLTVPGGVFHDTLVRLGYGSPPGSGLGIEKRGYLAKLPWSRAYTQASVSFGHELTTTLWQHASALTTVVGGGVLRPLRLFTEVGQGARVLALEREPGARVFGEHTCAEVRAMMRLGATEGTGAPVLGRMRDAERWRAAAEALEASGVLLYTKTGTAEKTPTEVCVHVELAARERWERAGVPVTRERYRSLRGEPRPHDICYTSSMCVSGRSPETGRELLVLVVVDEPRGREKFGSRVAGPAAFAILAEALGLTRDGRAGERTIEGGFVARGPGGETL